MISQPNCVQHLTTVGSSDSGRRIVAQSNLHEDYISYKREYIRIKS